MSSRNNAKPAPRNIIFNASAVGARLAALKAAAVAAGLEDSQWWKPALEFEWASSRTGNNSTRWSSINYTDENGVKGRLLVRFVAEYQTGRIMPRDDAGVAKLAAENKNPAVQIKKREKKASIQIQKWSAQVKTAEDGVTILQDAEGNPILPGDDKLSPYYRVAFLVNEAFVAEASERVARGNALVAKAVDLKKKNKAATAKAILDAFADENGVCKSGDIILSTEGVNTVRKLFTSEKDSEVLFKGATLTAKTSIAQLIQERISDRSLKNAGKLLPNPMTRFALNFDANTGVAATSIFDKNKPFMEGTRQKFEVAKVNGTPVNADNVHEFVLPRSGLDGIACLDAVCFSSMGISIPAKCDVLVVSQPSSREMSLDDVYDDEAVFGTVSTTGDAAASAAAAGAAAAGAAVASATSAGDAYGADLLAELSGTAPVAARGEAPGS